MADVRTVTPAGGSLGGRIGVPGDKSIAHRALIFNAIAAGEARIAGMPCGADVESTARALRCLGVGIEEEGIGEVSLTGTQLVLRKPAGVIDCGNSATTMRLLAGLLAGQSFDSILDGDRSLRRRPMRRVALPLEGMGARVETDSGTAPLSVYGRPLLGASHALEVASAQIKSALLLAGMQARGRTEISEPRQSRDHSERMLAAMGVEFERNEARVAVEGPVCPRAMDVEICGDLSSAAFPVVAAAMLPGSEITIEKVGLNPTRMGFVGVLRRMGADISTVPKGESGGEPVGDLTVKAAPLSAVTIEGDEVPATVDELPVLAVAAATAAGETIIRGATELRYKESDRIAATAAMLSALGIEVRENRDGLSIRGGRLVGGVSVESGGDHRIAMSAAVAAMACVSPVSIEGADCVAVSFPTFFQCLEGLRT